MTIYSIAGCEIQGDQQDFASEEPGAWDEYFNRAKSGYFVLSILICVKDSKFHCLAANKEETERPIVAQRRTQLNRPFFKFRE